MIGYDKIMMVLRKEKTNWLAGGCCVAEAQI
jgi:hypothetical protein